MAPPTTASASRCDRRTATGSRCPGRTPPIDTFDGVAIGWRDAATLLVDRAEPAVDDDDDDQTVVAQVDASGATIGSVTLPPASSWRFEGAASTGAAMVFAQWWGPVEWLALPE